MKGGCFLTYHLFFDTLLKTEYEVEEIFINQLDNEQGYSYIDMANYDDVLANFRMQFCKVNAKALIEAKGVAELSDSEFNKILLRLDNHTIYESAKILREKWVLELDNGKTIYAEFLTFDTPIRSHIRLPWIKLTRTMWSIKIVMM